MSDAKSILRTLEDQGRAVPRVQLPDGGAGAGRAPAAERYEIVGEIARGGFGVVCRGRDADLGREVAVKLLRDEHLRSPEMVRRFVEEAQIGGQLQHPGIVPVFELGVRDGRQPYFAMRLVKGRTLADLLSARSSPAEDRHGLLAHFADACQAVAYAHSRGVIHRDLKPGNVMVGAFGEVQVVDWGLAKVLKRGGVDDERRVRREVTVVATLRSAAEGAQSVSGSVMGTPAYMPPEQALGQVDDLTERADVFSLGAILCEILTGKPPYTGGPADLLTAAAQGRVEDAYASLDACGCDAELVALAKACLRPLPKDRPRSAREVAGRLVAHLSGAEGRAHAARVRATEEQVKAEEQRRARRQTLGVASAILVVVILAAGGLLAKTRTDATRERERTLAFEAAVQEATRLRASGEDWPGARSAADRAVRLAGTDPARREEAEGLHEGIEAAVAAADRASARAKREADLLAVLDEIALRSGDTFDARRADAAYAAALSDEAVLADFARREELAAHFDRWGWLRRESLKALDWRPLDARARALDPDSWRNGVRETAAAGDADGLRALAADPATVARGPLSLDLLGSALRACGDTASAVSLLLRAAEQHPADFWIRFHLGLCAGDSGGMRRLPVHFRAALENLRAAVALRPDSVGAHNSLGAALWRGGDVDEAMDEWRAVLRLDAGHLMARRNIGIALRYKGDADGAVAALGECMKLDPAHGLPHLDLGYVRWNAGDLDGAIASFREAIRLDPSISQAREWLASILLTKGDADGALAASREWLRVDPASPGGHSALGDALRAKGDLDGAIAAFREAVRLDPTVRDLCSLGAALEAKGDLDGTLAASREAIRLDPRSAVAHNNLGGALMGKGEAERAIASYREAISLDPELALAHANLGGALAVRGELEGAVGELRKAVRLAPQPRSLHLLGLALRKRGDIADSVESLRRAASLDPGNPDIRSSLAAAERDAAAQARLPAVLSGEDHPQGAEDWRTLAQVAYLTGENLASVRCWQEAFRSDPQLAADLRAGYRYNAACAAALAGSAWHDQAFDWLWADLRAYQEMSEPDAAALERLRAWRFDPDLLSVRDADDLPEGWRALWADVDALLARADGGGARDERPGR